ncbi:glycosyltransferase family 1 protein [Flavobacterium silvisoli]|uniref:Glycosyltransferase family 1 protein n=1 Tax=Flavobacterium silvisoli TaxID=2529433 RepID=A0A4Q9YY13_9FLAO|nr:glycosyltransferase [Flavobacterium silvisoli]TBX68740.1 glycosyltransferase family 1 protein [Flavobacterium silvisoli]
MRFLLVGEYSRLHNSLKEGLEKLGHEVIILGFKDGFKNFPVDFPLVRKWNSGILKKIRLAVLRLTGFDISSYLTYRQFLKNKSQFEQFDAVQLINENSFFCNYYFEKKIVNHIFKNNKKVFLLSCSDDYLNVQYNFENPQSKSGIQPYLEGKIKDKDNLSVLKFRTDSFRKLHQYIYSNCSGIIASDFDYDAPLKGNPKYLGVVPNPINTDLLKEEKLEIKDKIIIFLGVNRENCLKKGVDFFEKALQEIQKKYPEKTEVIITENVPYNEYIHCYTKAHILLDQCYAKDQGYNALEAMAKGKVVFTGAEQEFVGYYNIKEPVAINAKPDVAYLVEKLSFLIENPEEIKAMSKRARAFIEKEHNYIKVAEKYLAIWKNN